MGDVCVKIIEINIIGFPSYPMNQNACYLNPFVISFENILLQAISIAKIVYFCCAIMFLKN